MRYCIATNFLVVIVGVLSFMPGVGSVSADFGVSNSFLSSFQNGNGLKNYKASFTHEGKRKHDYVSAKSSNEATQIIRNRYAGATQIFVTEVK